MYSVRRVYLGKDEQLDTLSHACGELYSRTVVSYWRMVRKRGLWLKPKHLMRWHTSPSLHAHTSDATRQGLISARFIRQLPMMDSRPSSSTGANSERSGAIRTCSKAS